MLQAGPVVAVPRHKQALKELLSDEQAHTQTRTWVFSKQSKNDDRCSIEVQKSIANTKAAAHLKAAVHTAMGQCDEFQHIIVDNSLIGSNSSANGEALEEFYVMVQKESRFTAIQLIVQKGQLNKVQNKWI